MSEIPTIAGEDLVVVLGGSGLIGREVARLAVAYGSSVISVTRGGEAPTDEPWTAGVEWRRGDVRSSGEWADALAEDADQVTAVINAVSSDPDVLEAVRSSCKANELRLVEIGCASMHQTLPIARAQTVHLRVPSFDPRAETGEIAPTAEGIAVGHAAMAALRAGLEADHDGILEPEDVAYLGDAMFIQ